MIIEVLPMPIGLDRRFMGSIGNLLNVLPLRFDRADGG